MSEQPAATTTIIDNDESVADDKLNGADEIAAELDEPIWRIYYLWKLRRLSGVYKDGNRLIGSKRVLRRTHHNRARTGK
jgi:hypothetical protein